MSDMTNFETEMSDTMDNKNIIEEDLEAHRMAKQAILPPTEWPSRQYCHPQIQPVTQTNKAS